MNQPGSERIKVSIGSISRDRNPSEVAGALARLMFPDKKSRIRLSFSRILESGQESHGAMIFFATPQDTDDLIQAMRNRVPDIAVEQGRFRGFYLHFDPNALRFRQLTERGLRKELFSVVRSPSDPEN